MGEVSVQPLELVADDVVQRRTHPGVLPLAEHLTQDADSGPPRHVPVAHAGEHTHTASARPPCSLQPAAVADRSFGRGPVPACLYSGRYQIGLVQARSWILAGTAPSQQAAATLVVGSMVAQSTARSTQMRWLQRQVGFSSTRA